MESDKKLFLLDAMALIYRAHFAFSKNPRINSKGLNTGAALGFTNSLVEILKKEKPTHIAVAFDTPAPTFRHKQFVEYKANRQEQPEDIRTAIPYVKKILKAWQIPVLELDGYEADDVIGTIAKKCSKKGYEVYMMTPDKDYSQLVEDTIFLYKPAFMGNGVDILGIPEVLAKWNIERVDQVTDVLGLQGDSVDNIPGIPGIGPKTASKLLKKFGSVENIVKNAHQLVGKQKTQVETFGDQGILSKELATIDIDVPIEISDEDLKYTGYNKEELNAIFIELEFRTLAKRIFGEAITSEKPQGKQKSMFEGTNEEITISVAPEESTIKTITDIRHNYHLVEKEKDLKELAKFLSLQTSVCFDTETTSLNPLEAELVGISFCYVKNEAYYIPIPEEENSAKKVLAHFQSFFENEKVEKIGQNIKYDILVLRQYGINVKGKLFDTMLAHYLIEPDTRHNMDILSEKYLSYKPISIETLIGKKGKKQKSMRSVPLHLQVEYAAEDADITYQLKEKLSPQLDTYGVRKLFEEIEIPLINVLADIESTGVKIDTEALHKYSGELNDDIKLLENKIHSEAGTTFNIASPKQLGEILFDKLKLVEKPKKTKSGQYATGEEILVQLASKHEIIQNILDYRQLQKLKNTYVDALPTLISPKDGLIHTSFNQAVAATGRLSSTNPNLQNIPIKTDKGREIRKSFTPRSNENVIFSADYSQVELRIMAAFSKDQTMIDAFKNERDIHATTAAKIFKVDVEDVTSDMRRKAKTANFGIIYGISAFGLSQRLNIPRKEAASIIDAYFEEFPSVKEYMDNIIEFARENEYVETILGRRRYLRDINSRNYTLRGMAERNAINAPIQGTAADIIKKAMINVQKWMQKEKLESTMILQVHDELVFDTRNSEIEILEEKIPYLMENAVDIGIKLKVETGLGKDWLEAH